MQVAERTHLPSSWRVNYIWLVAAAGSVVVGWALFNVRVLADWQLFAALTLYTVISAAISTVSERSGISFSVSHAISIAAAVLINPAAGVLLAAIDAAVMWTINTVRGNDKWRGSVEQLCFNVGMVAIAAFVSGSFLTAVYADASQNFTLHVTSWATAAILFDQINMWLVAGVIYFQRGVSPVKFWWRQRWAMPTNIAVAGIGGGILVSGVNALDIRGVVLFTLPLLLLMIPFHVYVIDSERQMRELDAANRELTQLGRRKDHMLAIVSHDMRAALGNIKVAATTLESRPDLSAERRARLVQAVLHSEKLLETIVSDIIDIERVQAGQTLLLERDAVDLNATVAQVVQAFAEQASQMGIALETQLAAETPVIIGDRAKLSRVVLNLVSNALKYSAENDRVTVSVSSAEDEAIITVADTGSGIAEAELPFVFDTYHRTAEHRHTVIGSGHGLAIVKAYVEAHGGTLGVTSRKGQGSTFTVRLPATLKL